MINKLKHCIIEFIKLAVKRDKMLGKPHILSLLINSIINSIKHEHSYQVIYEKFDLKNKIRLNPCVILYCVYHY